MVITLPPGLASSERAPSLRLAGWWQKTMSALVGFGSAKGCLQACDVIGA